MSETKQVRSKYDDDDGQECSHLHASWPFLLTSAPAHCWPLAAVTMVTTQGKHMLSYAMKKSIKEWDIDGHFLIIQFKRNSTTLDEQTKV